MPAALFSCFPSSVGDPMLFKKLFQLLVVGGAVVGATSGCAARAQSQSSTSDKKPADTADAADAGPQPDAGTKESGGGAPGW